MLTRFDRNQRKYVIGRAVFLLILSASAAEQLRCAGGIRIESLGLGLHGKMLFHRAFTIAKHIAEGAWQHLLKAECKDALRGAARDHLARQIKSSGAR